MNSFVGTDEFDEGQHQKLEERDTPKSPVEEEKDEKEFKKESIVELNLKPKIVPSKEEPIGLTKEAIIDLNKTPKLIQPIGFKPRKVMNIFGDCMDIPDEGANPIVQNLTPTSSPFNRWKHVESSILLTSAFCIDKDVKKINDQ